MPNERVLRGSLQVFPRAEGGRNLVIFTSETDSFRIPLEEEQAQDIGRVLSMSDEDFETELGRRAAASRLTVVGDMNGNTPH